MVEWLPVIAEDGVIPAEDLVVDGSMALVIDGVIPAEDLVVDGSMALDCRTGIVEDKVVEEEGKRGGESERESILLAIKLQK